MLKLKKRYLILKSIAFIILVLLFFLSTIIKNYVVKHSEELIGRKLSLNELHINYFKVQLIARDFTLYEENKTDTFVYFKELLVNYDPWKMLGNEYAVSQIRLENPYVYVQQNGETFNFDSMIPPADSVVVEQQDTLQTEEENVKFSIRNIELINGEMHYYDKQIDNLLQFDKLNLALPLIAWDSRSSEMGVQFSIGESGLVKIDANIDQQLSEYNIGFGTENIQLNSFTNYLKDYMHISELNGLLQSDIRIKGHMKEVENILISGKVGVDSLSLKDDKGKVMASAISLASVLDSIDLGKMRFTIDKVLVDQMFISAALNKEMSNWEYFFDPVLSDTLQTEPADSTAVDAEEAEDLYYRLDTILVQNSHVLFEDNTLNRPFAYDIKNINISMHHLSPINDAIPLSYAMNFTNEGQFTGETHFSLQNPLKLFYDGKVSKLDLHSFSPYTEYYLGYPIVSGMFNYDCRIDMTPEKLDNQNHLLVQEPEFGKKTKDSTAYKLPLKLALYLIKDANDNVEFELPVSGNPSDPGFKLGPLIWKTFGKFIAKTATQPFGSLARLVGTHPEELEMIPFKYTQDSLMAPQRKVLDKIAEILTKKEELIFSFRQETAVDEELALLAEKTIKQQYITDKTPAKITSWQEVDDSNEDFINYLNKTYPESIETSIKERYQLLVPKDKLQSVFNDLYAQRNQIINDYLTQTKACKVASVKTLSVDFKNMPQELKHPGFRVEVSID